MQTKLTLRLESDLIRRAKAHAEKTGKSLSRLVADFFGALNGDGRRGAREQSPDFPPKTRALLGALRGKHVSEKNYRAYLERKHR